MNPLRMFESVARHENLTRAAEELHVTQSAVSRQVALLENYLGVALFRRGRHGVSLTPEGRKFAGAIVPAFSSIAAATDSLIRANRNPTLQVRTYMTFAAKVLIPNLQDFEALHPEIDLVLSTNVREVDFDADEVDLAIQFGDGQWPNARADLLFRDTIEPVCSPKFLEQYAGPDGDPKPLLGHRLLISHYRRADWDDWLGAAGLVAEAAGAERMTFSSSVLTWQAAIDGLGTAIGQTAMLSEELKSGRLVRPFGMPLTRELGHYLLRPANRKERRGTAEFAAWLMKLSARLV